METGDRDKDLTPDDTSGAMPGGRIEFRPETAFHGNAALLVQADRAELSRGAALVVVANEVNLSQGVSWVTVGREVELEKGGGQWIIAGEVEVEQGGAGIVIARDVQATDMKVGVLLAGNVTGNVQTMLDRNTALYLGAGLGAVLGVSMLLRRLFR